jgi:hypothetical protein
MNSKGMPPRTSERLIGGSFPFQKPYSGATAILVDEFDARQLKCPSEHNRKQVQALLRQTRRLLQDIK